VFSGKKSLKKKRKKEKEKKSDLLLSGKRLEFAGVRGHDLVSRWLRVVRSVEAGCQLINPSSDEPSDEGSDDWHPEPVVSMAEHVAAVSDDESEESRSEVTRRVARVSGIVSESRSDHHEHRSDEKGLRPSGVGALLVRQMGDEEAENGRGNHLINETVEVAQMSRRVRSKNSRRGFRSHDVSDSSVESVDRIMVHEVGQSRSEERASRLYEHVQNEFQRRQLSERQKHQRHGRIDVSS